jgi:hypothetical protein
MEVGGDLKELLGPFAGAKGRYCGHYLRVRLRGAGDIPLNYIETAIAELSGPDRSWVS